MAKRSLTAAAARGAKKPGLYRADPTLYLRVAPGGSKQWIQRIVIKGRRRDIGLGAFPVVGLTEARDRAFENRRLVRNGGDPLAERRAVAPTFRDATRRTFEANRARWRNGKHTASWLQTLERHAYPVLAELPVDTIGREEVLKVLTPIWSTRQETARRVRQRIRTVLGWAMAHGYVHTNAAGEAIDGALPSMPAVKRHYRALPYRDVAAALETVKAGRASDAAKLCFRFTVLTAARSGEARGATWGEIDLDAQEWRIPPERMKAGSEHRVPLSGAALDALEKARTLDDGSGLAFPSPSRPGRQLSDMALTKVLRDVGLAERATVHGFRTSFRTWAAERTNAEHAVMELSLAHAVGNAVEQAYARSDLLAKRRRLMEQWAGYITGTSAEVVNLHG
ncbi:MAG: tyrosine-type recombinase/integrase [Gammaproteobacteria bacterium]|nr:tyrosine-type recombinase/integrase [Gammaproteobacteria bacterium]